MGVPIYDFKVVPTPIAEGVGEGSTLVSLDVPLPFEQILFRTFFDPMRSFRNISMSPDKSATLYMHTHARTRTHAYIQGAQLEVLLTSHRYSCQTV